MKSASRIQVSFLERTFFAEDRTRTTVRGYEPAAIIDEKCVKLGRVIIPDEISNASFLDTVCFQTQFPLCDSEIDLVPILEGDAEGRRWLQSHIDYHFETYGKEVSMTFLIKMLELGQGWEYHTLPKDYLKRVEGGKHYRSPKAVLHDLPETVVYCKIIPPVNFSDGKRITNLYYNRKVRGSKGVFDIYHISDPSDTEHFQVAGVLLGVLNKIDLQDSSSDFEDDFPFEYFLDVCYPVSLRQAGRSNPLNIKVELVK